MLTQKRVKYKKSELKVLFETLNNITNNNYTFEISKCIVDNIIALNDKYREVMSGVYVPDRDPAVQEYNKKTSDLLVKFADKNEDGSIKIDQKNNPIITEKMAEFQEELKKLQEENKELIEKVNKTNETNANYMNEEVELAVWVPEIDEESKLTYQIPPTLVYYLFR